MERLNLLHVHGKRCVERWRFRAYHGAFDEQLRFGWLPDGRWWVDATWERHIGWVTADEVEARAWFAVLLSRWPGEHRGEWEQAVAEYEPGSVMGRPAVVPPRPPGVGPA